MTRGLHLFAVGFNGALVMWGAFLLSGGVKFGAALVMYGVICGASATCALRREK